MRFGYGIEVPDSDFPNLCNVWFTNEIAIIKTINHKVYRTFIVAQILGDNPSSFTAICEELINNVWTYLPQEFNIRGSVDCLISVLNFINNRD